MRFLQPVLTLRLDTAWVRRARSVRVELRKTRHRWTSARPDVDAELANRRLEHMADAHQGTSIDMLNSAAGSSRPSFGQALAIQMRVIGAVLMRELHTRYGRENVGYLWLVIEPLMLGSIISLLHSGQTAHQGEISPVAITVVGYTIFIMFRGIVNRAEGTLHANLPLMYHKMVGVFDLAFARALLELAGTMMAFLILLSLIISIGYATFPFRPLMLLAGIAYIFFFSLGISLIIVGGTHDNRLLERMVHPFTYFMIPLSAAFYQVVWIPQPYRDWLLYNPFPQMFELVRYGQFETATLDYVDFTYMTAWTLVLNFLGLLAVRSVKRRIHLS